MAAITAGPRTIVSGNEYNNLFSAPTFEDPIITRDGELDDTLKKMAEISQSGAGQVIKLAAMLAGTDVNSSCKNIHNFVVRHIQYAQDKQGVEQLRTPVRTWHDRKNPGVDCDCMSIFISSLLRNMNIKHRFRIVSFGPGDFEHVYVVVPRDGSSLSGGQIILDGVIHQYDREKSFTKAQDYTMSGTKIQLLNGMPLQVLNGTGLNGTPTYTYSQHEVAEHNRKLRAFFIAQRDYISNNPGLVRGLNSRQAIDNLNYALNNWDNEHSRIMAIELLAQKEQQYNPDTMFMRSVLAFFEGAVSCDNVCASGYVQLPASTINQIRGTLSGNLKGSDYLDMIGIDRWNIEHIAFAPARGAFMVLMRLNVFGWAEKMAPAFFPVNYAGESGESSWYYGHGNLENKLGNVKSINYNQQYTRLFGLTAAQHLTARKKMFDYVLRRWFNMGGDWDELKTCILKGAHKMLVKARPMPGYQYWCKYKDKGFNPQGTAGPTDKTPNWSEIEGLSGANNGLGVVETAALLTAAAAVIAALAPFVAYFQKPSDATIDPNTGLPIPTNPTTNPDPTGHPNAALNAETGMWTDAKTGEYYNPLTSTWEGGNTAGSFKKMALYLLAALGIGYGIYSIIPDDKQQKKLSNGK